MNPALGRTGFTSSRRRFLQGSGLALAGTALTGALAARSYVAEAPTIKVALVGCGGRGTGAAADALSVDNGPIKLVAMADVFEDRLSGSYRRLHERFAAQMDVPEDRRFTGFDAYRNAMDCLGAGDVVILATPPAFRWVHFGHAIGKGLHVFMEKPVTVDGPTTGKLLKLAAESEKRNLKVGVGLMWRHCRARRELCERIRDGQIGQLIMLRAYRMHGPIGSFASAPKPQDTRELLYQVRRFHSFLWASGGAYSDFYIHNIDECCWMKDAWPVKAQACGGRHYRGDAVDQNFDNYSVEYTFADGTKLLLFGRCIAGCYQQFGSLAHGSGGSAIISTGLASKCGIFKGQDFAKKDLVWSFPQPEPNPYRLEWADLIDAIRRDLPYNEARRGAEASLVSSMGRMAAHTGRVVTYDEILNHPHEFAPEVDRLTMDSPAPLQAGDDGRYPVPSPGIQTQREY